MLRALSPGRVVPAPTTPAPLLTLGTRPRGLPSPSCAVCPPLSAHSRPHTTVVTTPTPNLSVTQLLPQFSALESVILRKF